VRDGFLYSHVGWIVDPKSTPTHWGQIKDLAKYPELRALEPWYMWILLFAPFCAVLNFGWSFEAMVYGAFVSTVLLYHGTFTINSLCHVWGKRVYATTDQSRNNLWLALITMGEGWHNNHHYYMTSANQGFRWYEIDMSYRILWVLEKLGIVWDVRRAPEEVVAGQLGGRSWLIEDQAAAAPEKAPVRSPGAGAPLPAPAPAAPVEDV
jgi:stearoyl-CoA desaturase (delta-9 desaturase)